MPLPPLASADGELGDADVRRHAHQLILPQIGAAGQRRLKNSRVLVIGADEVGAPVLAHLADAGVGVLGIADGSPLHAWDRCFGQPAFGTAEATRVSRAAAWETALRTTHPSVTTEVHETRLGVANAASVISQYDVVLTASEDPAVCCLVDDVCVRLGKPFIWGEIDASKGRTSVFWDVHGPTYRDLYPSPPTPYFRGMAGVLKTLGGWLAVSMAMETAKLLTGMGDPLIGRMMEYDAMGALCQVVPVARHHATKRSAELTAAEPYCGLLSPEAAEAARESTISAEELKELLDSEVPICLVDVREPDEHAFSDILGSTLIPKGEFFGGDAVARLPQDQKIVLFCRMGIRSAEALAVVKRAGHSDAFHLGGGIIAWAQQVDSSMPTY
ncbi:ThiF family adenylyltransferase [Streptomyces sp. DT24]|uniref:ThiF family adenylyltransferase n=1 Tax=unclassified Streptomyces TaxID=2593676 RepID=UPI003CF48DCB